MAVSSPSAEILTLSSAPADQLAFSAASMAGTRMTPLEDAPVAATRASPVLVLTTNTPVREKRDVGWLNLDYAASAGLADTTCVIISTSASALANVPCEKSSALIARWQVSTDA